MTRARELARLANENVFTAEDYNSPVQVGINSTDPTSTLDVRGELKVGTAIQAGTAGVVTATEFSGSIGTFSGAGSFGGNLDVTGNVTIGGTLTYEDVTNIDVIGIVTAQNGVNISGGQLLVGSGVTIGNAGVATFSGTSDIHLLDNVRLNVGDGSDLRLYHNGSHSFIDDQGTGNLIVRSDELRLRNTANDETYLKADNGSSVDIYFNNSKRFETTKDGTITTGIATATGGLSVTGGDFDVQGGSGAKATFKHSAGWGAIRSAGSAGGSGAGFILANNYSGTIEEKWSIYLDGSTDDLRFTAGPPETTASEKLRINSAGDILAGTSTSRTINSHSPRLQVSGYDYSDATVSIINNEANANGAYLFLGKQRSGGPGGSTVVQEDDIVGQIRFPAGDGTDMESYCAQIEARIDGTPGGNDVPGRIQFYTTADGASSPTEKIRVSAGGTVSISQSDHTGAQTLGADLVVADTTGASIIVGDTGSGEYLYLAGEGQLGRVGTKSNHPLVFYTNGISASGEKMRITSSGLVGIGTDNPTAYLSFNSQRSVQTMPPICFQASYATDLADAAISTTDDSGGVDIMMGSNVYMGQNGAFVRYKDSYGSAAVRCQYTGITIFYNKSGNNAPVESLRITGGGYREIRNAHFGAYAFTDNSAKTTITIGDPGDSKCTTVRFLLTLEDVSYRQGFWQGEYTVFVSNATGGPGVNYYLKEHWQQVGSTNWSGGSVTVSCTSGGAVQVTATNGHNDANGDIYVHILQVVGDIDGSTVASISA